jgi:aminotransferase
MTGWRIGYALGNADFIAAMTKIHQYTMLCAPITAQIAAIEAIKQGTASRNKMVDEYDRRRRLMVDGLRNIGLDCFEPRGAFYVFPSIRNTGLTSLQFAEQLLQAEKVALVPGDAFGACGEGFVRCSYASSSKNLAEALDRIGRFVTPLLK